MSVDFSKLPLEEVLLLDAVEGMCGQYGHSSGASKADAVLMHYGLYLDASNYDEGRWPELETVATQCKKDVGYWSAGTTWKPDRSKLNFRSETLLIILVGLSYSVLMQKHEGNDILSHDFMSAGEAACFQLVAYSLLNDAPWGGYCNDEGKAAATMMLSPEFEPMRAFRLEDLR